MIFDWKTISPLTKQSDRFVRKYDTDYVVSTFTREIHIRGCDNYDNWFDLQDALQDPTQLVDFPQEGEEVDTDDIDCKQGIAPLRVKQRTFSLRDPTTVSCTLIYDNDPDSEVLWPKGFPQIDAMWHVSARGFYRQTFVDVDNNPILVCSPRFDAASPPADVKKYTKPVSVPQWIPQRVCTISYAVDVPTMMGLLDYQGKVNDGIFLGLDKGSWLCESVIAEPCQYRDINNPTPPIDPDTLYMVTIVIITAGPTDIMTKVLGTKQVGGLRVGNPYDSKLCWNGLGVYVENNDGRIPRDKDGNIKNGKPGVDEQPYQEVIVTLYKEADFTALGPDEFGVSDPAKMAP